MKKIRILFIGFILISSGYSLNAQFIRNKIDTLKQHKAIRISQTDKYSIHGTSIDFVDVQDTKMTPLIYSGPGIGFDFGTYKTREKFTSYRSFNLHYSVLFGPSSDIMHGVKLRFNSGKLYQLNSSNWKIGGSINIETNARIYPKNGNDLISAELLTTLNFAAAYSFNYKKNNFNFLVELPLAAYVLRYPDYSVTGFNGNFMPIGRYKALRTKFTFIKPLKYSNENRYSISYEWDMYAFNEYDKLFKLVSGAHLITFSYWLKKM